MTRPFITHTFADVVDHAQRTDMPLVHAIALDTLGKVQPTSTRLYRLQMFGPCKVCGEAKFICEHDDGEFPRDGAAENKGGAGFSERTAR